MPLAASCLDSSFQAPGESVLIHVDFSKDGKRRLGGSALAHVYDQVRGHCLLWSVAAICQQECSVVSLGTYCKREPSSFLGATHGLRSLRPCRRRMPSSKRVAPEPSPLLHLFASVQLGNECPDVDVGALKRGFNAVQDMIGARTILSGHDISDGGLLTAALEMAFAGNCGLALSLPGGVSKEDPFASLYAEELGLLIEVSKEKEGAVLRQLQEAGVPAAVVGRPQEGDAVEVSVGGQSVFQGSMVDLRDTWEETSFLLERIQRLEKCAASEQATLRTRTEPSWNLPFTPEFTSDEVSAARRNLVVWLHLLVALCVILKLLRLVLIQAQAGYHVVHISCLHGTLVHSDATQLHLNARNSLPGAAVTGPPSSPQPVAGAATDCKASCCIVTSCLVPQSCLFPASPALVLYRFQLMARTDKPKVAILREEGSNGDREMAAAVYAAGMEAWDVSMSDLLSGKVTLDQFRGIVFVGGFRYAEGTPLPGTSRALSKAQSKARGPAFVSPSLLPTANLTASNMPPPFQVCSCSTPPLQLLPLSNPLPNPSPCAGPHKLSPPWAPLATPPPSPVAATLMCWIPPRAGRPPSGSTPQCGPSSRTSMRGKTPSAWESATGASSWRS